MTVVIDVPSQRRLSLQSYCVPNCGADMSILAIALDVDGVLTDGGIYWDGSGGEWKRFSFRDIMGVSLGRKAGLRFALISGEDSPLVDRYAVKMGIEDVYKGCKDKAAAVRDFAARRGLDLAQICFMGDDVNDIAAMQRSAWPWHRPMRT